MGARHNSQEEDFVPLRRERLVLGLRLKSGVDQLEDAEGVRLAADVRRRQTHGLEHLDRQVADLLHLLQRVLHALRRTGGIGEWSVRQG